MLQLESTAIDLQHQVRKGQIWIHGIGQLLLDDIDQISLGLLILIVATINIQSLLQVLCLLSHGLCHEKEQLVGQVLIKDHAQ